MLEATTTARHPAAGGRVDERAEARAMLDELRHVLGRTGKLDLSALERATAAGGRRICRRQLQRWFNGHSTPWTIDPVERLALAAGVDLAYLIPPPAGAPCPAVEAPTRYCDLELTPDRVYTTSEVAELAGCTTVEARELIAGGCIRGWIEGGRYLVAGDALVAWLDSPVPFSLTEAGEREARTQTLFDSLMRSDAPC